MSEPQLNLVVIRSADPERTASFYRELGLTLVKHAHGTGPEHFACESGHAVFEIYPATKSAAPTTGVRLGFRVADVDEACKRALAAGGSVVSAPAMSPWGRRAVINDVDGSRIELNEAANSITK